MINWFDQPYPAYHKNGWEVLIYGVRMHPSTGEIAAVCVGEDGSLSVEDITDLALEWRYDRKRGWHGLEDVTEGI